VHAVSLTPYARFLRSKIDHIAHIIYSRIQKARESGAQGVLFDEKTEGRKSRDTVPLATLSGACLFALKSRLRIEFFDSRVSA
jgi:hypothetical protein